MFVQFAVDATVIDVVIDGVRQFTVVVDNLDISREDMVTVGGAGEFSTVTMPDYLVPLVVAVAVLACRPVPQAIRPNAVASNVLD